jgi:alpha-tubulin suppressor-like RCC1 family protein
LLDTDTNDKLEWIEVECGEYHTVGLTGQVFTWGHNYYGQLGHGDRESRTNPTKILGLDGFFITKISCGKGNTAALTKNGEILAWYVPS